MGAAVFGLPGASGRAQGWVSGCGWQGRGAARGGGSPGPSVGITQLPSLSQPCRCNIYCKSRKLLITKLAGKGAGADAVPHWHSTCLAAASPASPCSALSSSSSPSFSLLSLSLLFFFSFWLLFKCGSGVSGSQRHKLARWRWEEGCEMRNRLV